MISIKNLLDKFNGLNVTISNIDLFRKLLDLDYSVYLPLIDEILAGRLDIEDTRPLLNKTVITNNSIQISSTKFLINSEQDLRNNLINKLFNTPSYIKEVNIINVDIESIKEQIKLLYFNQTGDTLTENQLKVLILAMNILKQVDISYETTNDKSLQINLSNALSNT